MKVHKQTEVSKREEVCEVLLEIAADDLINTHRGPIQFNCLDSLLN